jgi:group I intron endonuclease
MLNYGIVYKITNVLNGKEYIGQTTSEMTKRWKSHKASSRDNRSDSIFHRALAKYGFDVFVVHVLCSCSDQTELDKMECSFIEHYNTKTPSGYNTKGGGANGKHDQITKDKMSAYHSDKCKDEQHRATRTGFLKEYWENQSEEEHKEFCLKSKNRWSNKESRTEIAVNNKKYWESLPKEEQEARTKGLQGYWTAERAQIQSDRMKNLDPEKKANIVSAAMEGKTLDLECTNIETGEIVVYGSLNDASKALGIRRNSLGNHLKLTPTEPYKGYMFKRIPKAASSMNEKSVNKPVKVINLSTGKETVYPSNAAVCKEFRMTAGTLIDILKGKRSNEYKGHRFLYAL